MSLGISLTGGGSRGAYQVGVLKGLYEIIADEKLFSTNPFRHWLGSSAGSINAAMCAAGCDNPGETINKLELLWRNIQPEQVYRTDFRTLSSNGYKWIRDMSVGGLLKSHRARSLLNTEPLLDLLNSKIDFGAIQNHIDGGLIESLAISAYSHRDNRTVTFLQSKDLIEWDRPRRVGRSTQITSTHILASCAIPLLFPAIEINKEYLADGSFRNLSPLSPLIQMGAKKIFMIGVRGPNEFSDAIHDKEPGVAKVAGVMMNSLFFDSIDIDLERIKSTNEMVESFQEKQIITNRSDYSKIDVLVIKPSRDIDRIAESKVKNFPRMIKFLLGGLGSITEASELASYLLFVPEFTQELIDLGYADILDRRSEVVHWLKT